MGRQCLNAALPPPPFLFSSMTHSLHLTWSDDDGGDDYGQHPWMSPLTNVGLHFYLNAFAAVAVKGYTNSMRSKWVALVFTEMQVRVQMGRVVPRSLEPLEDIASCQWGWFIKPAAQAFSTAVLGHYSWATISGLSPNFRRYFQEKKSACVRVSIVLTDGLSHALRTTLPRRGVCVFSELISLPC